MDRNVHLVCAVGVVFVVATREGGVDRNTRVRVLFTVGGGVATREGGVDRNMLPTAMPLLSAPSPPARVAWIETSPRVRNGSRDSVATREGGVDRNVLGAGVFAKDFIVATREGGVDRNTKNKDFALERKMSPPARVAWIETPLCTDGKKQTSSRHPRGWRG